MTKVKYAHHQPPADWFQPASQPAGQEEEKFSDFDQAYRLREEQICISGPRVSFFTSRIVWPSPRDEREPSSVSRKTGRRAKFSSIVHLASSRPNPSNPLRDSSMRRHLALWHTQLFIRNPQGGGRGGLMKGRGPQITQHKQTHASDPRKSNCAIGLSFSSFPTRRRRRSKIAPCRRYSILFTRLPSASTFGCPGNSTRLNLTKIN